MSGNSGSRQSQSAAESGAKLLARFSDRPDLKTVDPFIFANNDPSTSQVIEFFGNDEVERSELALSCVAKIVLPVYRYGIEFGGLEAKVFYIDTEYMFSILRLADVLEKSIRMKQDEHMKRYEFIKEEVPSNDFDNTSDNIDHCYNESFPHPDRKCENSYLVGNTYHCNNNSNAPDDSKGDNSSVAEGGNTETNNAQNSIPQAITQNSTHKLGFISKDKTIQNAPHFLSTQEIEEIVKESLSRFQLLRAADSQKLLTSLLSLELVLQEDPLYALVVIDSISAVYWPDRLSSLNSYNLVDARLNPIGEVLSRYVSKLDITCLITKCAYFNKKKAFNHDESSSTTNTHSSSESFPDFNTDYQEYFGKTWRSMERRIVFVKRTLKIEEKVTDTAKGERKVTGSSENNDVVILALCKSSQIVQQYVYNKEGVLVRDVHQSY